MILRLHRDERGIILGFLLKLLLALGLVAAATMETTAVVFARVQAQDMAESAANVAAGRFDDTGSARSARIAATRTIRAQDADARLGKPFVIRQDGSVKVVVMKPASTVVIQHVGFLKGFTVARGKAVGRQSPV
jgi:hypothetical protein